MTQPRREIARVSELLKAQLLQDININPVQPSLSVANLNIAAAGGPARLGLNEYTPLFERNCAQSNVSGEIGNQSTPGDEVVVSGLYDRHLVSAGQLHYDTDGFRNNFDLRNNIYNLFAQYAISSTSNVQTEPRTQCIDNGDRTLNYDSQSFDPIFKENTSEDIARIGAKLSFSPNSDLVASLIYKNIHNKQTFPKLNVSRMPVLSTKCNIYFADAFIA